MDEIFINTVVSLYNENKWKDILKLTVQEEIAKKLLWVWPSENNIDFIQKIVRKLKLEGIISIGCGCGLFEWLLQKGTDLSVIGYEVNQEWWLSKYCSPKFITLEFPKQPPNSSSLPINYALLFCYFNNGKAFQEYVKAYDGQLIFIIGPGKGRYTHTDPEPFKPNLNADWKLGDYREVKNTKDFIVAYIRTTIN